MPQAQRPVTKPGKEAQPDQQAKDVGHIPLQGCNHISICIKNTPKQPKCAQMHEQINKMWSIHTMECDSPYKGRKF